MTRRTEIASLALIVLLVSLAGLLLCGEFVSGSSRRGLADPGMAIVPGLVETICLDGLDNDGDGLADCDDPDCIRAFPCASLGLDEAILENDRVRLRFVRTPDGLVVESLTNRDTGRVFGFMPEPLWEITFRRPDGAKLTVVPGDLPHRCYFTPKIKPDHRSLHVLWKNARIDPGNQVDVLASFVLDDGSPLVRARLDVQGSLQDLSLFSLRFPRLDVVKIDGSEDNFVLYPSRKGGGALVPRPEAIIAPTALTYPTNHQLSFLAYFNRPAREGITFSCEDPEAYLKRFVYDGRDDSMFFALEQLPEGNTLATSYAQPFDYVFGPFEGGWWDAADRYRQWALSQPWTPDPFETRAGIPEGLRNLEINLVVRFETPTVTADLPGLLEAYRDRFGLTSIIALVRSWDTMGDDTGRYIPDYFPEKPGTIEQIAAAHAVSGLQVFVLPGTGSISFDPRTPSYEAENAGLYAYRDENLEPIIRGITVRMDSCTDYWRNKQKTILIDHLRQQFGADGAWFDSFVVNDECYDPAHGHTVGGGVYVASCIREMLANLRDLGRATLPDYFLAEEPPTENFMDLFLFREGDYCITALGGSQEVTVPLLQAVYHEFSPTLASSKAKREDYEEGRLTPAQFDMLQAHGFSIGARISVSEAIVSETEGSAGWFIARPEFQAHYGYLEQLVDAEKYARKYLSFGRLLRPLGAVVDTIETEMGEECESLAQIPAVERSVWRASDGDVGLVFTNWTDEVRSIGYAFDVERFGLDPGTIYSLYRLDASGRSLLGTIQGYFERTEVLDPKSALVLELSTN